HRSSPEKSLWFNHQDHSHNQENQKELEDRKEENAVRAEGAHNKGPDKSTFQVSQAADDRDDKGLDDHGRANSGSYHSHGSPQSPAQGCQHGAKSKDPGKKPGNIYADGTGHLPV